ncbi:carbohydrate ABC transporter permease [uncultured Sphaerochaeta sp.]|uniref:carbohydrate ABC transporter permease n=1 Tax=uncultured Sphaerochaeta sp. TaxID=886478 RepID=UPI002A0A32C3|nr:carbohydrate ABC transporter permease [uncultured Sphaerochaeta sp.]
MKHVKNMHKISWTKEILSILAITFIFVFPFWFIIVNSLKSRRVAGLMNIKWPDAIQWSNYSEVFSQNDFIVVRSFVNSIIITFISIILLLGVCALAGFVLQRRSSKTSSFLNFLLLVGLMIPPTILPTIWVMDAIGIYRTLWGMILVEVALNIPFTVMLFRGFVSTIPKEIEEAAIIDGCDCKNLFLRIIFPLLKPVSSTVIVLNAVTIFNDFTNPLYFLPGQKNATVQLTLNTFMGQYASSWNLLFADVVLITIPPLILFIFFNKKIIGGMTAGAVKG